MDKRAENWLEVEDSSELGETVQGSAAMEAAEKPKPLNGEDSMVCSAKKQGRSIDGL